MNGLKDTITSILAVVVALGTLIATALENIPADAQWYVWIGAAVVAVFGYFMGKNGDGSTKLKVTKH